VIVFSSLTPTRDAFVKDIIAVTSESPQGNPRVALG